LFLLENRRYVNILSVKLSTVVSKHTLICHINIHYIVFVSYSNTIFSELVVCFITDYMFNIGIILSFHDLYHDCKKNFKLLNFFYENNFLNHETGIQGIRGNLFYLEKFFMMKSLFFMKKMKGLVNFQRTIFVTTCSWHHLIKLLVFSKKCEYIAPIYSVCTCRKKALILK
jgi:hypothetical protein